MRKNRKQPMVVFWKWWIMALIGIWSCAVLAGCGSKETEDETELIRVGFSQVGAESSWRVANSESMKEALSEGKGFELIFDDAKQKQENQYKAIRTFIQQKVDYIVLAPITETGWDDVLQEAKQAGIPVLLVDRQVAVEDESLYTTWVGSDFLKEGENAMLWLEQELELREMQEDVHILHVRGTEGATAQILRTKGLEDAVESHSNWSITTCLDGEYTEAKAYELTKEFIKNHPSEMAQVNVIYSENDNMTFGVMRALEENGIKYGGDDGIILISFDAVRSALEMCLEGKINLDVECNPLHGARVANLIRQLEGGHQPQKRSFVGESSFSYRRITEDRIRERAY